MLPPLTLSLTFISLTLLPALHAVIPPTPSGPRHPPTGPRHAPTGPRHSQTQPYRNSQTPQKHKPLSITELQEPDIYVLHSWNFKSDKDDEDLRAKSVSTNNRPRRVHTEDDIEEEIQKEKDREEMKELTRLWEEDKQRDEDLKQTIHNEPTELVFGSNINIKHMMQGFDREIVKVFEALAVVGTNIHWKWKQGM